MIRKRRLSVMAERLAGELLARSLTIAVAESCTGGLLADLLTDVAGISGSFMLGVTAYSNEAKRAVLGLDGGVLEADGAVSAATAAAMALGVRKLGETDIGVGITGIAGPSGGGPRKPVGLVYVGVETPARRTCSEFRFEGPRRKIKEAAAYSAMKLVLETIR